MEKKYFVSYLLFSDSKHLRNDVFGISKFDLGVIDFINELKKEILKKNQYEVKGLLEAGVIDKSLHPLLYTSIKIVSIVSEKSLHL